MQRRHGLRSAGCGIAAVVLVPISSLCNAKQIVSPDDGAFTLSPCSSALVIF